MNYRLGIDTGGTYTDAVLIDEQDSILCSHKSLTTRNDLTQGIRQVIAEFPLDQLKRVNLVSLSTTLTTNSVVEGRGVPVCVLLPGYDKKQIEQSGLNELLGEGFVYQIPGGANAHGKITAELDLESAKNIILAQNPRVSAFAVSAMFGVRNPLQEIQLKALIEKLTDKPVASGHELSSSLGAPGRALTAALNARMIPRIKELVESVKIILAERGIQAPLMIVKGDGSLISAKAALHQPVMTVLSGPAASVVGAGYLSDSKNFIVADMGGTTTDIAIVSDGKPVLSVEGALLGNWQPMVEAVKIFSIGLGGDSEVHFRGGKGLVIGPRRVVPMSLLGHLYPEVIPALTRQQQLEPNVRQNRFIIRFENNPVLIDQLDSEERRAWEALEKQPLEMNEVVSQDRALGRALARLERNGLAIYSGFTPSDAAHVLGLSDHWSVQAAELSASIWAWQMRNVYGLGNWSKNDIHTPCEKIVEQVTATISAALIEAGMHHYGELSEVRSKNLSSLLTRFVTSAAGGQSNGVFHIGFSAEYKLIAVGAPAAIYYPEVARRLGVVLETSQYGGVANAVGAVMGVVSQRAQILVSQPEHGVFHVYHNREPEKFSELSKALAYGESLVRNIATDLARNAGAEKINIHLDRQDKHIKNDIDGDLFLEAKITATASGRPQAG